MTGLIAADGQRHEGTHAVGGLGHGGSCRAGTRCHHGLLARRTAPPAYVNHRPQIGPAPVQSTPPPVLAVTDPVQDARLTATETETRRLSETLRTLDSE